jgi:hypothetical protein
MKRIDPSFSSITWNIAQTGEQPSKVDLTDFAVSESGNIQPIEQEDEFITKMNDLIEEERADHSFGNQSDYDDGYINGMIDTLKIYTDIKRS